MMKPYLYGAMALGLLLTACDSDKLPEPVKGSVVEADQTFFISMRICGDPVSSRSSSENGAPGTDDFEEGTENKVNNAYFVFYNDNGDVVGDIVPIDLNSMNSSTSLAGPNVEKSYTSVVAVDVKKGETKPTQVICYINPISPSTLNRPINVIQTVARTRVFTQEGDNTYFAMSNAVYYDDNNNIQIAVKIPADMLYPSESAAEAALLSDNTLNIYVERYASKLKFEAVDPTDYKTGCRVYDESGAPSPKYLTLKFEPQYWAVNAESNTSYVIKSYREESASGTVLPDNYNYTTLNRRININTWDGENNSWDYNGAAELNTTDAWAWNNPTLKRSYWAMSPAYFTHEYPEVSSDLSDIEVNQKYIAYEELNNLGFKATNKSPQYFKETTVGSAGINASNPRAAVASVIYVGQYNLYDDNNNIIEVAPDVKGDKTPGFYTYQLGPVDGIDEDRPYVYFENEANSTKSKVNGYESMLKRFFAQQTILYKKILDQDGKEQFTRYTFANAEDLAKLTAALEVSEVSDEVKQYYDGNDSTKLKLQNNARTLQFKDAANAKGIYILTGTGYMEIVADNVVPSVSQVKLTEANVTIMRQVGLCYYYKKGLAYFSIPVKHLGWYRKGNTQKDVVSNDSIDWGKVRVGDFGMVRNHSYNIEVSEIVGLANGIGDERNPIVPPKTSEKYYMAYSVNILKWAVVPTQVVKM